MERPYGISDFAFPTQWDRESGPDLVEKAGCSSQRDREHGQTERDIRSDSGHTNRAADRSRMIYRGRDREYLLRASEVRTLTDTGKFRVVPVDDLARFGYQGNRAPMERDIRNLTRQGLVESRTIEGILRIRREF
jgi:IS4 transposase